MSDGLLQRNPETGGPRLAFTFTPKGVPVDRLGPDHHEILRALLDCYLDRIPPELADAEKAKLDGGGLSGLSCSAKA